MKNLSINNKILRINNKIVSTNELAGQLGVLDLSANGGNNPNTGLPWAEGDTYRFAFASSTSRDATSSLIADYNTHVQDAGNASGLGIGVSEGVTWKAIASTATIDADVNTGTDTGSSEAIFLLNSTIICNNYTDLWDGSIDNALNLEEDGVTITAPTNNELWTGTEPSGVKAVTQHMGNGGNVQTGRPTGINTTWVKVFNRGEADLRPLYAISSILTIKKI